MKLCYALLNKRFLKCPNGPMGRTIRINCTHLYIFFFIGHDDNNVICINIFAEKESCYDKQRRPCCSAEV